MEGFTQEDWYFILDCLNDRLENLVHLNDMGAADFTEDIAQCEDIIDRFRETL